MLKIQLENPPGVFIEMFGGMQSRGGNTKNFLQTDDAHDRSRPPQKNHVKAGEGGANAGRSNGGTAKTARSILLPDFKAIPTQLRSLPRWVVWKGQKVPYCATAGDSKASVTSPSTWATFEQSQTAFEKGSFLGVGLWPSRSACRCSRHRRRPW